MCCLFITFKFLFFIEAVTIEEVTENYAWAVIQSEVADWNPDIESLLF
jgi:hypothetical protein